MLLDHPINDDVTFMCDSVWILELRCLVDGIMYSFRLD